MKIKMTSKAIRSSGELTYAISYCGAQHLLRNHQPIGYNAGVYGWNYDVYTVYGVHICTGYRGMPGRTPDWQRLNEYEHRARAIAEDYSSPREDRDAEIEALLHEWILKEEGVL